MAINPVSIPSAGALEFGHGDVRHFSEGDALGVAELQTPTRMLAQRDVLLATSLNEVIAALNNQEQYVPLPVMHTVLSPSSSEVVANYRIPKGFEARVLNAAVSSIPASSAISLKVTYSPSFGSVAGVSGSTEVVNTTSETESGGVQFNPSGEFIVTITNSGSESAEVVASVVLTMRPLGGSGGLLVGTVVAGERGQPGAQGAPGVGVPGPAGVEGPPGKPGIRYLGVWTVGSGSTSAVRYFKNDAVTYPGGDALASTFIALRDITEAESDNLSEAPLPSEVGKPGYPWGLLARGGVTVGTQGPVGPGGQSGFRIVPVFGTATVPTSGFDSTLSEGDYNGFRTPNSSGSGTATWNNSGSGTPSAFTFGLAEASVSTGTNFVSGMAFLYGSRRIIMRGDLTITLPAKTANSSVDWSDEVVSDPALNVTVALNGTTATLKSGQVGSAPWIDDTVESGKRIYRIKYDGTDPAKLDVTVFGMRTFGV